MDDKSLYSPRHHIRHHCHIAALRRFPPFYQRICAFYRASANVLSRTTEAGNELRGGRMRM